MIFRFVVWHLRWLARVPLLPQIFDALLLIVTILTRAQKFRAMEALEIRAGEALGATAGGHRFGGTAFIVGGREIAHVHGNGLFDALLPQAMRDKVIARGLAEPHHVFPASGWVSLWMRKEQDADAAMELLHCAAGRGAKGVVVREGAQIYPSVALAHSNS